MDAWLGSMDEMEFAQQESESDGVSYGSQDQGYGTEDHYGTEDQGYGTEEHYGDEEHGDSMDAAFAACDDGVYEEDFEACMADLAGELDEESGD